MRAATYSRFSSDAQSASSIEDQQRNCRKRAEAEGWRIVAQYSDAAMTGSNNLRPDYRRMLAAVERKEFAGLLVDDLSRLSRDSLEQERAIREIEFTGVRLIAVSDGYDSNNLDTREMQRGFKGLMNQQFLKDHAKKVHRGSTGKALRGFWQGGRPYGYRLRPVLDATGRCDPYGNPVRIGTVLEPDPATAPVVREIFAWNGEGLSCCDIAERLNARGTLSPGAAWQRVTRRCNGWMSSAVRSILKNPLYRGQQRWNTHKIEKAPKTGKDRRRARPESEWIVNQIESLRLVTDATFNKAAARFRSLADGDPR